MPRRASYIPLSHDDYAPHAFRPIVRTYRGGPTRLDPEKLAQVKHTLLTADMTFPQVARKHGYSAFGLRAAVKRMTGMTIAEWRVSQQDGASAKPIDGSVADPP